MKRWIIFLAACGAHPRTVGAPPLTVAAATPAAAECRSSDADDIIHEEARERAALDQALRAQGFTPLVTTLEKSTASPPGTKWMEITELEECVPEAPTVAMTSAHEVFIANAKLVPASRSTVSECNNSCSRACGTPPRPVTVLAQVPEDARLVTPRMIDTPIDVQVTITYVTPSQCVVP